MLEEKTYTKAEIESILGTNSRQSTTRKLSRYGVEHTITKRGDYLITIDEISDPFKIFSILELGVAAQTDFNKLREFVYYFFCDDEFPNQPNERKEQILDEHNKHISRQTIAKWVNKLEERNWVIRNVDQVRYYFTFKGNIIDTTRENYLNAWRDYHTNKQVFGNSRDAIFAMIECYGGVAKKILLPQQNKLYIDQINQLISLATEVYEIMEN